MKVDVSRRELEEHKATMTDEGMAKSILNFEHFTREHYVMVLFAGHVLASKPAINFFKVGNIQTKTGFIPAFYAENPHLDYRTRLAKFLDLKGNAE